MKSQHIHHFQEHSGRALRAWQPSRALREVCGIAGLMMLVYAVFGFSKQTPFPSLYALVPTVGTALIILFATQKTVVGKFIGNKFFVGIGLISYSAYLWHQPVFAFARHRSLEEPSKSLLSVLAISSIALAYISWKYVETPFRRNNFVNRKQVFLFSTAVSVALLSFGFAGSTSGGFSGREIYKDPRFLDGNIVIDEKGSGDKYCHQSQITSSLGPIVCVIGDEKTVPSGVLWGDSFAGALMYGLDKSLRSLGRSFFVVLSDGCIPIVGASRAIRVEFNCTEDRHRIFVNEVIKKKDIEYIVWIGSFATIFGKTENDYLINGIPANPQLAKYSMLDTLRVLNASKKKVIFVGDTPRFRYHSANYRLKHQLFNGKDKDSGVQTVPRQEVVDSLNNLDFLDEAAKYSTVVDAVDIFCDKQCSSVNSDGKLLFMDSVHLSHRGSVLLADAIARSMF